MYQVLELAQILPPRCLLFLLFQSSVQSFQHRLVSILSSGIIPRQEYPSMLYLPLVFILEFLGEIQYNLQGLSPTHWSLGCCRHAIGDDSEVLVIFSFFDSWLMRLIAFICHIALLSFVALTQTQPKENSQSALELAKSLSSQKVD